MSDAEAIAEAAIAGAEAVAGTAHDQAARALLAQTLAEQRRRAWLVRGAAPSPPPACRFDPRLPGWRSPPARQLRIPRVEAGPLPDHEADIAFASVGQLGDWLRRGLLTAQRLTAIYLARIGRHDGSLQSFATVTADLAMRQARRADQLAAQGDWRGPLHGIPYGCKDIIDTAGIPTEWGAEPYRGRQPVTDSAVVTALERAGAVLLGKTSVGALASGDMWRGRQTRNPWRPEQGSSGSSAGSAAAVAAGLCGFALGTETLGSIVCPSLRCGATGLRPTFGRVSRVGVMPLAWSLDKVGALARTVTDTALVTSVLTAATPVDPSHIALPFAWDGLPALRGVRLGFYPSDLELEGADALDRVAIEVARGSGAELVALRRPDRPYDALQHILHAEAAAAFEDLTLSGRDAMLSGQGPRDWPNVFRAARFLSAVDHMQLERLRRQVMQDLDLAFADVDVMIGPPVAGPMLTITNFTGHPCLVLRSGFLAAGVPYAVCLWGRLFDEAAVLAAGLALERAFGLWQRRPTGLE